MKTLITDPLGDAVPINFGMLQRGGAITISQRNNNVSFAHLARTGLNMLIRATELNGGAIPLVEQILVRRPRPACHAKRLGAKRR